VWFEFTSADTKSTDLGTANSNVYQYAAAVGADAYINPNSPANTNPYDCAADAYAHISNAPNENTNSRTADVSTNVDLHPRTLCYRDRNKHCSRAPNSDRARC
jgi:hypothetical protein